MMKKILILANILLAAITVDAQNLKLGLFEEFTSENCSDCATKNPALYTKINAAGNENKILLLTYHGGTHNTPGPIFLQNQNFQRERFIYYLPSDEPWGILNGNALEAPGGTTGDVALLDQVKIDAAHNELTPFTMSVANPVYAADGQSFSITVTVTATQATTASFLRLRVALAETLDFTTAPGTNGETSFPNVVRQLYTYGQTASVPGGENLPLSWTAGQTGTYTITGSIPSYVKNSSAHKFFAAWIQEYGTGSGGAVLQAARTSDLTLQMPGADAALTKLTGADGLICQLPATLNLTATLKNTGQDTLTAATIYYRLYGASWNSFVWTGSVAPEATAGIALPAIAATAGSDYYVEDSVALPNNKIDFNAYDNEGAIYQYVTSPDARPLPIASTFETYNPEFINWISYPGTAPNGYPVIRSYLSNGAGGTDGGGVGDSDFFLYFPCGRFREGGVSGYMIMPKATMPAGPKTMDFYISYAERRTATDTISDMLELVYSTDCAVTWNTIWTGEKDAIASFPPVTGNYVPTADRWKKISVDVSTVPTNTYFAFRITSNGGNNMFIDNVNVYSSGTSVQTIPGSNKVKIYPNPVMDQLHIELDLPKTNHVTFSVQNILGQASITETRLVTGGKQIHILPLRNLMPGVYFLDIRTDAGSMQQKFIKQ